MRGETVSALSPDTSGDRWLPGRDAPARAGRLRVGLVCDYVEEQWPSMDLVAERLAHHLAADFTDAIAAERLCPPFRRRLSWLPGAGAGSRPDLADRLLNRVWDYPRWLRATDAARRFDVLHVIDHSYAHLASVLPADRTVVTCHDVDAFRALSPVGRGLPSRVHRVIAGRLRAGLRRAAVVTCDSEATRDALLARALVPAERTVVVYNGVHPSRSPAADGPADAAAAGLLGNTGAVELLHVGSTIPRKRIDLLLRVFAAIRAAVPDLRLVRVGGPLTASQAALADALGVTEAVCGLPFLSQPTLSAVYRRAALLLLPSDSEGFGLPVVEALASGTPVVATDVPVLREVGGSATTYVEADVGAWCAAVRARLHERQADGPAWEARRRQGLEHAARFRWSLHASAMVAIYRRLGAAHAARAAGGLVPARVGEGPPA